MSCYERKNRSCFSAAFVLSFLFLKWKGDPNMVNENKFQAKLIKELKDMFPGCMVLKNDPSYMQGVPDLLVLHNDHWASLECKKSANARRQPNQDHYVNKMDDMSFSRFIYPENKDEVLNDLKKKFNE